MFAREMVHFAVTVARVRANSNRGNNAQSARALASSSQIDDARNAEDQGISSVNTAMLWDPAEPVMGQGIGPPNPVLVATEPVTGRRSHASHAMAQVPRNATSVTANQSNGFASIQKATNSLRDPKMIMRIRLMSKLIRLRFNSKNFRRGLSEQSAAAQNY